MKKAFSALLVICAISVCLFAEGYTSIKGGLSFPRVQRLQDDPYDRFNWNFGIEWGGMSDVGIGFGGNFDIFWKWSTEGSDFDFEETNADTSSGIITIYEVDRQVRRTMFNLGLDIVVDPLNESVVHPIFRGAFGPVMLVYINREFDDVTGESELTEHSGVYWGLMGRAGVDAGFNLSDKTCAFIGAEYQWGRASKRKWGTNYRYVQPLSGVAFRIGFRFL